MFKSSVCQFPLICWDYSPKLERTMEQKPGSSSRKLLVSLFLRGTLLNLHCRLLLLPVTSPASSQGLFCFIDPSEWIFFLHHLFLLQQQVKSGGDKQMVNNEKAKDDLIWELVSLSSAPSGRTSWLEGCRVSRDQHERQWWHVAESAEAQIPRGPREGGTHWTLHLFIEILFSLDPQMVPKIILVFRHKFVGCVSFLIVKTKA